jgi:hypothetical protein
VSQESAKVHSNSRGFPYGPIGNRFYHSNASKSDFNSGIIRFWDLGSNTSGNFSNPAGAASADPVACVAMGASLANNTFTFFGDRRNGQVRRVADPTARTIYASGFIFPDSDYNPVNVAGFAGLAFDNNGASGTTNFGDLFVTSGGSYLYRVRQNNPLTLPDDTTVAQMTGGFNGAAGLYFDHFLWSTEYQTRTLFIADRVAGSVLLYHSPTDKLGFPVRLQGYLSSRMAIHVQADFNTYSLGLVDQKSPSLTRAGITVWAPFLYLRGEVAAAAMDLESLSLTAELGLEF